MEYDFERLGRDHATVVLLKLIFAALLTESRRAEHFRAAALAALGRPGTRDEFDDIVSAASREFVDQVFGLMPEAGAPPSSRS